MTGTKSVTVRLPEDLATWLDLHRGKQSRASLMIGILREAQAVATGEDQGTTVVTPQSVTKAIETAIAPIHDRLVALETHPALSPPPLLSATAAHQHAKSQDDRVCSLSTFKRHYAEWKEADPERADQIANLYFRSRGLEPTPSGFKLL